MQQRIADFFNYGLVEFGVFAVDFQRDILADFTRDIVHHALETVKGRADFYHPQLQRAVAHFLHQA